MRAIHLAALPIIHFSRDPLTSSSWNVSSLHFKSFRVTLPFNRGYRGEMASFAVTAIDHVVLTVKDLSSTIEFYTARLGMKHEPFDHHGEQR